MDDYAIDVAVVETEIVAEIVETEIVVEVVGSGPQGPAGQGVAPGGSTGDVLTKTSATDYAVGWTPLGSLGGDKAFSQAFTTVAFVTVTHNLGKRPAVTVIDSAGDEVIGDVDHLSLNQFTVTFSAPFSGIVFCN